MENESPAPSLELDPERKAVFDAHESALTSQLSQQARESLYHYACTISPDYDPSLMHYYICKIAQEAVEGKRGRRIIINAPPRHGKTRLIAQELPSWYLGEGKNRGPKKRIAMASYSGSLTISSSRRIRERIQEENYQLLFPSTRLKADAGAVGLWETTEGGGMLATSIGGSLTGFGADLLIIDDVHKNRMDAESLTIRENIWTWYESTALTRLSPDGIIIIIMTRWHCDDLVGRLTDKKRVDDLKEAGFPDENYEVHNLPAMSHGAEIDPIHREQFEPLWPERWTKRYLQSRKASMSLYEWNSLYDQNPMSKGGNEVDVSKLIYIDRSEVPTDIEPVRCWDLAVTDDVLSDYSAGVRLAYQKPNEEQKKNKERGTLFIIHAFRHQKRWGESRKIINRYGDMEQGRIRLEAVGAFQALYDEIKQDRMGKNIVSMIIPKVSKMIRAAPWFAMVDAGKVKIVRGDWNMDYVTEIAEFPLGKHDDQVDATSMGWEMLTKNEQLFID